VADIVRQCLEEGKRVQIDGLGTFLPEGRSRFRFVAHQAPSIFLAYVQEDGARVERLFEELELFEKADHSGEADGSHECGCRLSRDLTAPAGVQPPNVQDQKRAMTLN
jgi:hypothetical protein